VLYRDVDDAPKAFGEFAEALSQHRHFAREIDPPGV